MKTEFVSTVSHELRTPLTAIKGYVDLIVSGQTGPVSELQQEFLALVQVSTRRLSALINDMLDVSRIESGRIALRQESVDYVPLIHQTARMMQNEAEQKQITLSVDIAIADPIASDGEAVLPPVIGDSDRITQVLVNLISNGIKYTPAGGIVTLTVQYENDFVTTCVADTGIGISREDQSKLFQKFFRADNSTTREVGGTGLGP
jgi:signal transduction histidine kinase